MQTTATLAPHNAATIVHRLGLTPERGLGHLGFLVAADPANRWDTPALEPIGAAERDALLVQVQAYEPVDLVAALAAEAGLDHAALLAEATAIADNPTDSELDVISHGMFGPDAELLEHLEQLH
jgi:hypothetical protein